MTTKNDLKDYVYEALKSQGGRSSIIGVAKHIWTQHEKELKNSERLFYTWQYDMRWAAQELRNEGKLKSAKNMPKGIWEIAA